MDNVKKETRMNIKEMEQRTGLSRANIRYYEDEGLLCPPRRENGYRDYGPEELDALLRIRLLRRLGLSLEEIRALQAGQLALPEAMEQRLRALEQEAVRNGQDQQVCRAMAQEQAEYANFDAERYWAQLTCPAEGAGETQPDTGPVLGTDRPEPFPWRRFAARWLDLILCNTLVQLPLLWAMLNPNATGYYDVAVQALGLLLMLLTEPLLLRLWGTTPGKWLMGLYVENSRGRRPGLGEAFSYTAGVLFYGMAFLLPILRLWRLWKSYSACCEGLLLPWEEEVQCRCRKLPGWRYLLAPVALGLMTFALVLGVKGQLVPRQQGPLTVAEFTENVNQMAEAISSPLRLNEQGRWVTAGSGLDVLNARDHLSEMSRMEFETDAEGYITSVRYRCQCQGEIIPTDLVWQQPLLLAMLAGPGSQTGRLVLGSRADELGQVVEDGWLDGFRYDLGDTHTEASTSWSGFLDAPVLFSQEQDATFTAEFSIVWS